MAKSVHITTARQMLNSRDPVDITLFTAKGCIEDWKDVCSISYDVKNGTRKMRFITSREVRQCRDACIISINGMEVYL